MFDGDWTNLRICWCFRMAKTRWLERKASISAVVKEHAWAWHVHCTMTLRFIFSTILWVQSIRTSRNSCLISKKSWSNSCIRQTGCLRVSHSFLSSCISEFLKSKIRILVTHQVHHLERADQILIFNDGDLSAKGTFKELNEQGFNLNSLLNTSDQNQTAGPTSSSTVQVAKIIPQPPIKVDSMEMALSNKSLAKKEKKLISEIKKANKGEKSKEENKKLLKEKKLEKRSKKLWRLIKRNQVSFMQLDFSNQWPMV